MNEINYNLLQQVHQLKPIIRTKVISAGYHLPKQRVSSDDLMLEIGSEKQYGLAHNWMSKEMGIVERRMVSNNTSPSELAILAAKKAIAAAPELNPDEINAVIFCGIERDKPEPATAHIIQRALSLRADHVFDVANACFGFFDGLKLASSLIESGAIKYALVTTGEVPTKMACSVADQLKQGLPISVAKNMWGMLSVGDAGGAMVVGPSRSGKTGFMKFHQASKSQYSDLCQYQWKPDGSVDANMNMGFILARGLKMNKKIYHETLKELGWNKTDWLVAHQTGRTAFEQAANLHGMSKCKIVKTYPKLGNITTATLPVSFEKLISSGNLKSGHRVGGLFAGSGLVAGQFGYIA